MQARQSPLSTPENVSHAEKSEVAALFHSGKMAETEVRARTITERYPGDVFGWKVLGMTFLQQGKNRRALPHLEKAASLSPRQPDIHHNLGVALVHLGRHDEAVDSFRRAMDLNPDCMQTLTSLGNVLEDAGRPEEAAAAYRQALALDPDQIKVHYNLGNILKDLGQMEDAVSHYRLALARKPDYAFALTNLGLALKDLGRSKEAEASARQALAAAPDLPEARHLLAALLLLLNEPGQALDCIVTSLLTEERIEAKQLFVECLRRLPPSRVDGPLQEMLVRALTEPWVRPNELAAIAANVVQGDVSLKDCLSRTTTAWPSRPDASALYGPTGLAAIGANQLLACLLDAAPLPHLELERFLTLARNAMLETLAPPQAAPDVDESALAFHAALARQCFINEYVFDWTDEEAARALALRDALVAALEADAPVSPLWLTAVAAYFPLASLPKAERLLDRSWPAPVTALLVQQIVEPGQERLLRPGIPKLTAIEDAVSLSVQRQYEENPYPRWIKAAPNGPPTHLDAYLREHFPHAAFAPAGRRTALDVLVAGCGTGQHSLETARRFHGARVLAVDLSLSSLAYAKRKTQELGITTIEYAQADILKLGIISRRFDVIEASGVLHHLADPFVGWRVLLGLLRPNGFMRLGFYSKKARRDISRIRALLADNGDAATASSMRRRRQDITICQHFEDIGNLLLDDFFSLSGCRDLYFHVQEHCLTLMDIRTFIADNNLKLLGFVINPQILEEYRQLFPDDPAATDLTHWHAYETDHPDTFIEMYQFWVQKTA
jgi:tetratricopeptide (TPR) repeat protein/2-polyprenyl-3-methyl-5-hydroxy-6-metoxy-1,4-benzoquinol methylase